MLPNGADDAETIQRAIDAAASAGGGVVSLPAGTFLINGHLRLKSNVKLTGVGSETVLKAGPRFLSSTGPGGGYSIVTTDGASNVTIANLTADQNGNSLNGNANSDARLKTYLIDVRNSHNVVVTGVRTRNPFTYSIAVVGSSDFCVVRCNTQEDSSGRYNQLDGIHILDSHTGQVIDNYVNQGLGTDGDDGLVAHTIGAPVYDVLYAGNKVRGGDNGAGLQFAIGSYPIYNVTVRDNDFYGSPVGIHNGYYGEFSFGALRNILIADNHVYDILPRPGVPEAGMGIDIKGIRPISPITDVRVINNYFCNAGGIVVVKNVTNIVARNRFCH